MADASCTRMGCLPCIHLSTPGTDYVHFFPVVLGYSHRCSARHSMEFDQVFLRQRHYCQYCLHPCGLGQVAMLNRKCHLPLLSPSACPRCHCFTMATGRRCCGHPRESRCHRTGFCQEDRFCSDGCPVVNR